MNINRNTVRGRVARVITAIQYGSKDPLDPSRDLKIPPVSYTQAFEVMRGIQPYMSELMMALMDIKDTATLKLMNSALLPDSDFNCTTCGQSVEVRAVQVSPFIWSDGDMDFSVITGCPDDCQEIQWQYVFPAEWESGDDFRVFLNVLKAPEWEL